MAKLINTGDEKSGTKLLLDEPETQIEQIVYIAKDIPRTQDIVFINNKDPSQVLQFHYHSKTHPLKRYNLIPGHKYTLPVEIIQHLEGQSEKDPYACHRREYAERMVDGKTELYVTNHVSYYQCRPIRAA